MNVQRLHELGNEILDHRYKGIPLGARVPLADLGGQGWNVARGDLALPVTTLRAEALEHNIATMAKYCARNRVLLAPHGKTTMSPQLIQRQLAAGAWGITVATPSQVQVMRYFGVPRVLLANQLADPDALRWIARELEDDASFEFSCLVDHPETVAMMDRVLDGTTVTRKLHVLVEAGVPGGRSGVRSDDEALAVAEAVAASAHLALTGVETYEGPAAGADGEDITAVDALLDRVRRLVVTFAQRDLFATPDITVTAGGSAYFDRVIAKLTTWTGIVGPVRLVLRSGCYISHDGGNYQRLSPLDGRRGPDEPLFLQDALQAWSTVLSRPEPGLVILGSGKRDLPYDLEPPVPSLVHRRDGSIGELRPHGTITRLMDQHAFMAVDPRISVSPGDIVSLSLSHPCAAFDKLRLIPIIDADGVVVDGVLTFF